MCGSSDTGLGSETIGAVYRLSKPGAAGEISPAAPLMNPLQRSSYAD